MPRPLANANHFEALTSLPVRATAPTVAPLGKDEVIWAESPAKLLHDRLVATFSPPTPIIDEKALSPRTKLAIVIGSSAALWLVIGFVAAAIL